MKKIKLYMAGLMLMSAGIFNSCDLDRSPLTSYGSDSFWTGEQNAQLTLTGLYHGNITFGAEEYSPTDWWSYQGLLMLDICSDNGWDRRGLTSNYGIIAAGTLSSSKTAATANYWTFSYQKIARCNSFLD